MTRRGSGVRIPHRPLVRAFLRLPRTVDRAPRPVISPRIAAEITSLRAQRNGGAAVGRDVPTPVDRACGGVLATGGVAMGTLAALLLGLDTASFPCVARSSRSRAAGARIVRRTRRHATQGSTGVRRFPRDGGR